MKKLLSLTGVALLLVACGTPTPTPSNSSNPSSSPAPSSSPSTAPNPTASASASTSVGSTTAIPISSLTQAQFLAAMKCGQAKAADGSLYAANIAVVTGWDATTWQNLVNAGGGGQYVVYKEAVKLGCNGT